MGWQWVPEICDLVSKKEKMLLLFTKDFIRLNSSWPKLTGSCYMASSVNVSYHAVDAARSVRSALTEACSKNSRGCDAWPHVSDVNNSRKWRHKIRESNVVCIYAATRFVGPTSSQRRRSIYNILYYIAGIGFTTSLYGEVTALTWSQGIKSDENSHETLLKAYQFPQRVQINTGHVDAWSLPSLLCRTMMPYVQLLARIRTLSWCNLWSNPVHCGPCPESVDSCVHCVNCFQADRAAELGG